MLNAKLYEAIRTLRGLNLPDTFYVTSTYHSGKCPLSKLVTPEDLPAVRDHNTPPWDWQVFGGFRHKQGDKIQHFWVETENRLLYLKHAEQIAQTLAPYGSVSFGSSWRWERTEEIPAKYIPIYTLFCILGDTRTVPARYSICESPDPRADWMVNDWCRSQGHDLESGYSFGYTKTGFRFWGSPKSTAIVKKVYSDCKFTTEGKGHAKKLHVDFP